MGGDMKAAISDIMLAPWITGVIVTAIRLRIFSILSVQELSAGEIAERSDTIPEYLTTLLDACVAMNFLEVENGKYRNSHFSRVYFVEGQRLYMGDFLKLVNDESLQWFQLPDIIRGKERIVEEQPYIRSDYKTFVSAMNSIGHLCEAEALRNLVDLSRCRKMIDVGGGSGLYSLALCQKYPGLHSTIFDSKETLSVTKEFLEGTQERTRIVLHEGDFLKDSLGDDVDVVLLSDVVYEDAAARKVLGSAWDCLNQDGVLIVRGYYADPERSRPLFPALFAVKELVDNPERRVMSIQVLERIVREMGFRDVRISPLTELSFAVIGGK